MDNWLETHSHHPAWQWQVSFVRELQETRRRHAINTKSTTAKSALHTHLEAHGDLVERDGTVLGVNHDDAVVPCQSLCTGQLGQSTEDDDVGTAQQLSRVQATRDATTTNAREATWSISRIVRVGPPEPHCTIPLTPLLEYSHHTALASPIRLEHCKMNAETLTLQVFHSPLCSQPATTSFFWRMSSRSVLSQIS
jgi:hypothetical protein